MFNLKCIISGVDGKKYCVRERSKLELAADRLATVNTKMSKLVEHCFKTYPDRENIKRLKKGYNPKKIMETLPTSEFTAFSQNKGEKMAMLYHFLTSNEFMQHMEAMLEGYSSLREGIVKERMQMEKMWKEREKQLDKVLLNTSGLWGSIKGIAGGSMGHIRLLEGGEE